MLYADSDCIRIVGTALRRHRLATLSRTSSLTGMSTHFTVSGRARWRDVGHVPTV